MTEAIDTVGMFAAVEALPEQVAAGVAAAPRIVNRIGRIRQA